MIEWKDESVNDLSGGITDLVTASGSEFQELCTNLGHNPKLQLLSSRDGYRRFSEIETLSPIVQLFKLESWIIALCENGQLYYRSESDTLSAWTLVETPGARTATIFRVYDSQGKGIQIVDTLAADQMIVQHGSDGGTPSYGLRDTYGSILFTVDTANLNSDATYDSGAGNITWSAFVGTSGALTTTLLPNTLGTDEVHFDGLLTPQEVTSPFLGTYPAAVRSDGNSTTLSFTGEDGHIQASSWQSHLFMALEPYLKTFASNPSDPQGEDPEAFPPTNQRIPLRKIVPASVPGTTTTTLRAVNAQLPKVYIGVDQTESTPDTYSNELMHYRYQVYKLTFPYATGYAGESTYVEIWAERTWGYQGVSGTMGTFESYLKPFYVTSANPIDAAVPYSLLDPILDGLSLGAYGSLTTPSWGQLFLVSHNVTHPTRTFEEVVEGISAAFDEYQKRAFDSGGTIYGASYSPFGYYIKVDPRARMDAHVDVESPGPTVSVRYADNLPDDVAGNHSYGYALYLRDRYKAMVEGSPRDFVIDGPAAFETVRTLSPITDTLIRGYTADPSGTHAVYTYTASPRVFGGISNTILRDSSLYFQSGMEAVVARTLDGGDVYYIEEGKKFWYRTTNPPTTDYGSGTYILFPDALLTDEDWTNRTSYLVVHEPTITDDDLQSEEQAYFNGGILSYDAIPQGPYYFTVVNQTGYYANIVGNIQRIYQSPPGAPYASPFQLFEDFEDEITGITSFGDKPVVTTRTKLWRVEGVKGADGSGRTFLRTVSDVHGCISNQSIVQTNVGVFLWSLAGIVWTDGMRSLVVTEHLIGRYRDWLNDLTSGEPTIGPEKLRGAFDELNRRVYWSAIDGDGKPFYIVLSLTKGISPTMPIVTEEGVRFQSVDSLDGEVTPVDYFETQAMLYSSSRQRWYRGQQTFLMIRDEDRTYDESHVDDLKHPIEPYLKSVAFAYGIPWARKQTSKIQLNLRDMTRTGVSMTPLGWNDLSETAHKLGNCLNYQHMSFSLDYATATPLDLEQFWRHSDCRWKSHMIVTYKRHFGKGKQRNCFKQVGFEGLKLLYGEIAAGSTAITEITLTHKGTTAAFPEPTSIIEITADNASNALVDLLLDHSGQFYVSWSDAMDPVPISNYVAAHPTYTITVLPGGSAPTNTADHEEAWPTLRFYRVFTDQRIDLLGYNLTYRLIGDRTHGALKSTEHGGVDA